MSPGEDQALARLASLLPRAPAGQVWAGDDAAVVEVPGSASPGLLAIDTVVGGLDADFSLTTLEDFGWKAMAVNLSDIAAMGGRPLYAVSSVVGLGPDGLDELYRGMGAASARYSCPIVGGDLSGGREMSVTVAVWGVVDEHAVLRSGARPGDNVWVSGPLGAAAAGLRVLRRAAEGGASLSAEEEALAQAHARPLPALDAGEAARRAGATAMMDVSDGFGLDLIRLAEASGVGLELTGIPVAPGATEDEALAGGEDFVLTFTCPPENNVVAEFARSGSRAPTWVGQCTGQSGVYHLAGQTLPRKGWEHRF